MKRLYAESNFVLELVFAQEQSAACEELLAAAEAGAIELMLPAFCLGEPLETLGRRHASRRELQNKLQKEFAQLRRVAEYKDTVADVEPIARLLAASAQEDVARLERFYLRLVDGAVLVPHTREVVVRSFDLAREFDLTPQDSVVLASVVSDLEHRPSSAAFVTKNSKDFDDPGVRACLEERTCSLLTAFGQAVGFALHGDENAPT